MILKLRRENYVRLYLEVNSVLKNQDAGTKILDEFPRPTCRSVYTVSDKRLRHGGSGYETRGGGGGGGVQISTEPELQVQISSVFEYYNNNRNSSCNEYE